VGLGALALGVAGLVLLLVARLRREPPLPWRRVLPLVVGTALLALYAASPRLALFGHVLVDLSKLYEPLGIITGPFRVAGRFIWPLTYVLVAGALGVWAVRRPRWAPWLFAVALVAQIADMKNLMGSKPWKGRTRVPVFDPAWDLAKGEFDHLALWPPRCADTSFTCCGNLSRRPYATDVWFADLATRIGVTLNSGGTARARRSVLGPYCERLYADIAAGRLDARTIYRIGKEREGEFLRATPRATCGRVNDELTCVAPEVRGRFAEHLGRAKR
jgi:hypothetical protein